MDIKTRRTTIVQDVALDIWRGRDFAQCSGAVTTRLPINRADTDFLVPSFPPSRRYWVST
jgi:hypothetical protein